MAIVYGQVKRKAEDAFVSVIEARRGTNLTGVEVVPGLSATELTGPRIVVLCLRATAEVFSDFVTGNYLCEMEISLVNHYTTDRDERTAMESELFDILMREDIVDLLNAADVSQFFVYGGAEGAGKDWMPESIETRQNLGNDFGEVMTGTLYCRPSGAG